jgi:nitroimidazol reductase NimA-like FMN-containing flavoprotein (pyridoxamine 5'-phosphate oxidase superfamily)
MSVPATRLTAKFSDPAATAVSWEETRMALEEAELFWISTVRADGRPHVTPLVAVWAEDAMWFTTGRGEQKEVNLRANPRVILTTGCNAWDHGLDVVVEGEAVHVTDEAALGRVATVWAGKWDGRWRWEVRDGVFHDAAPDGAPRAGAMVFAVRPEKVFAHSKGDPFGETRHTF